jgi:hypothetical protein
MFHPLSRDLSLVGSLLPLFTREITADPEQHNRARREARIRDLKQMGSYMRETRMEAERRKDDELRARLDGVLYSFADSNMADHKRRGSHRPIATAFESCYTANITDCSPAKAHRETLSLIKFERDSQRERTYTAVRGSLRPWSVNFTISISRQS